MAKLTKKQRVLNFLKENGKMNHMDGLFECKTNRLAAVIFNLRKEHQIETVMVNHTNQLGEVERVAEYKLIA